MAHFVKKIYECRRFWNDLQSLLIKLPCIILAFINRRIDRSFASKIMLAVTTVNGCRYCKWFHTNMLLGRGVDREEIKRIVSLQINEGINAYELTGITYAGHFARTDRNPDPEMTQQLFDYYGDEKANDILLFIELVFFSNLVGNTFDAFVDRFRGNRAEGSSFLCEFVIFLLSAPVLVPLMLILNKQQ